MRWTDEQLRAHQARRASSARPPAGNGNVIAETPKPRKRTKNDPKPGSGTDFEKYERAAFERVMRENKARASTALLLPLPPGVNGLYLNMPGKGRVISPKYRAWRKAAELAIEDQHIVPVLGPIRVTFIFGKPDRRKRDQDGLFKAPLDFCTQMGIISDDSEVLAIESCWLPGSNVMTMRIEPMEPIVWPEASKPKRKPRKAKA
jgi:crossover junction endodeoxyribonuclease RusA